MQSFEQTSPARSRKLVRSTENRVFAGVCGGLAEHFGISANWLRFGFIWAAVLSSGAIFVAYIVFIFCIPLEGDLHGGASWRIKRAKSRFHRKCRYRRSRGGDLDEQYALVEDKLNFLEELLAPQTASSIRKSTRANPALINREQLMDQYNLIEEKIRRLEDHVTSRDYVLSRKFEDL